MSNKQDKHPVRNFVIGFLIATAAILVLRATGHSL